MKQSEKPRREYQWTDQYYEESKQIAPSDIIPIVVPSYKRGENSSTIQMLSKYPELKVILFIYEDERELYQPILDKYPHITACYCSAFRGIAPKRKYINLKMVSLGMPRFFVVDDDVSSFSYTRHGAQVNDPTKYKATKVQISPLDFFRMFQYIIYTKADRPISSCGIIFDNGAWAQDLVTLPDIIYIGGQVFCIYMDAGMCLEKRVNYVTDAGWEDFDFSVRQLNAGLNACQIRYLTAATPTMNPGKSVSTEGEHKWTKNSAALYKYWGELIRFKPMKGELNAKIRWTTIRNQLQTTGHLTIKHNPNYMQFINAEDYVGLLNYVNAEKHNKEQED